MRLLVLLGRWPVLQPYEVIQPQHEGKGGMSARVPHILHLNGGVSHSRREAGPSSERGFSAGIPSRKIVESMPLRVTLNCHRATLQAGQ
jgi:hypothetical protein